MIAAGRRAPAGSPLPGYVPGGGIRKVRRLPARSKECQIVCVREDYRSGYVLADFDLRMTAAALGDRGRIGFASGAGAAAYSNINAAGGTLDGAGAAGITAVARFGRTIEVIVRNALAGSLGRTPSLYVNGTEYPLVRLPLPAVNPITQAGMVAYSAGHAEGAPPGLAAGDQWAAGDEPTVRLVGRQGVLADGTLAAIGDDNPAGRTVEAGFYQADGNGGWTRINFIEQLDRLPAAPADGRVAFLEEDYDDGEGNTVESGYYSSEEGEWKKLGSGAGGGVSAAVVLKKAVAAGAETEDGLEIALRALDDDEEPPGADYGLVTQLRNPVTNAHLDLYLTEEFTDDRVGIRITLDAAAYAGERGNRVAMQFGTTQTPADPNIAVNGPRYDAGANVHRLTLWIKTTANPGPTVAQVVAAINANAGTSAALINGADGTATWPTGLTQSQRGGTQASSSEGLLFHGGVHEDHVAELDEDAKTYTLKYDPVVDPLSRIAAFILSLDDAIAVVTHGAEDADAPEAPGFTRSFEGRRGVPGRHGDLAEDQTARRAAADAQADADAAAAVAAAAGVTADAAGRTAAAKLGGPVFAVAPNPAGWAASIAQADGSGNLYFVTVTGSFTVDEIDYRRGQTFVWDESRTAFIEVGSSFDVDSLVRLTSFRALQVNSAALLQEFLSADNSRRGAMIIVTADFTHNGVDYVDGERWIWDTSDNVLRLFYANPDPPPAATAATAGLVALSNATPLGPTPGGSAGADSLVPRQDHQHPPPTGAQLETILDAYYGNTVWRSAHTVLRTAVQVRDLLATVLGANWWQSGSSSSGITLDQALDGVGAMIAALGAFQYDAAANTLTFALRPDDFPADSIGADKIIAATEAQQYGWRREIGAAHISVGITLPALATANEGDIEILSQDVAAGLSFRDISQLATEVTAGATGDVFQVWEIRNVKTWVRLGNLIVGARVAEAAAAAVEARLPAFLSITHVPSGISAGNSASDWPDYLDLVFTEKITTRTITGATLVLDGSALPLNAGTPISGIDSPTEHTGLLRFDISGATKINLAATTTRHGRLYAQGRLTISFSEGADYLHDFAWPIRNPIFAKSRPQAVHVEAAAATAVNSNAEVTLLTARITPQSTASRIRVDGQAIAKTPDPIANNNNHDVSMRLRLYRGAVLLAEIEQANLHAPNADAFVYAMSMFSFDAPASVAEQTYTLRASRSGRAMDWSMTRKHLLLTEVL